MPRIPHPPGMLSPPMMPVLEQEWHTWLSLKFPMRKLHEFICMSLEEWKWFSFPTGKWKTCQSTSILHISSTQKQSWFNWRGKKFRGEGDCENNTVPMLGKRSRVFRKEWIIILSRIDVSYHLRNKVINCTVITKNDFFFLNSWISNLCELW